MAYLTSYDARQLRTVLGTFTTGVTIVTTRDAQGVYHGVTANSFSSVSLEPPLVLWSQALTSRSFAAFRESDHFAVNILADDQVGLSTRFARSAADKFAEVPFSEGLGGVPVLEGTVAHFECVKVAAYPAGDHVIYVGRVERVGHSGRRPLAFAHGRYMVPYAHELGPLALGTGSAPAASAEAVRLASDALPGIRAALGGVTVGLAVWGNHGPTAIRWEGSGTAGLVLSLTRTATGRAFAAFLPEQVTAVFLQEDLRLWRIADEDEVEQRQRLDDELAVTRQSGVARAVEVQGEETLHAFSAPVFNAQGQMIFALSTAAAAERLGLERDGAVPVALVAAAKKLTERLFSRVSSASGTQILSE